MGLAREAPRAPWGEALSQCLVALCCCFSFSGLQRGQRAPSVSQTCPAYELQPRSKNYRSPGWAGCQGAILSSPLTIHGSFNPFPPGSVLKELGDKGPPRHGRAPSLVSQEDATHKESRGGLVSSKRVSACDSWGLKGLRDGLRLATAVSAREREEQTGQLRGKEHTGVWNLLHMQWDPVIMFLQLGLQV